MPKTSRALWAGFVLLGLGFAVTCVPKQARAEKSPTRQETVLASRNPSPGLGGLRALHHKIGRQRLVRRRFHGPRVIGVDGAAAAPVPQENEEADPLEPNFGEFGYRRFAPSPPVLVVPPQIITLPDVHAGARKAAPRERVTRAAVPHRRVGELHRDVPRFRVATYRAYAWPVPYICWPLGGVLIPVAFAPCDDPPHSAIYNTPCGVRPYH